MTATRLDEDFTSSVHVYEPHRAGLPRLGPYLRELWRRRAFASELSRTTMRAANTTTVFGQLWLVINPLLLAAVYFVLVTILRGGDSDGDFFAYLVAGLFAFYFVSGAISTGAASVVGGGKLLLNTSFPRLLLPLSAVRTAFGRFLPTIVIYLPIHLALGLSLRWTMLLAVGFLAMMVVFATGMAMIFATAQVYFRDTASFLPYFIRIWLYLSPILWYPGQVPDEIKDFMILNPLYPMIGGWSELLGAGEIPQASWWVAGTLWAMAAVVVGSLFFMSREREFAVRL